MARSDWAHQLDGPEKPLRAVPCSDCAVVCGMYQEISDKLAKEPKELQREVAARWFCHNQANMACRGNWNNLARAARRLQVG